jgi:hypothetical protein
MCYKTDIKQVAMDEFYKLTGGRNTRLKAAWTLPKFKRITKLMRYAHRAEGVWS